MKCKDKIDHNYYLCLILIFQLRIQVTDQAGVKSCSKSQILTIVVRRNENAPVWSRTDRVYETTILETQNGLDPIIRVTATDADVSVSGPYSNVHSSFCLCIFDLITKESFQCAFPLDFNVSSTSF